MDLGAITMGRVMTRLKVTNATDLENAALGTLASSNVRSVELEALVDTGATKVNPESPDVPLLDLMHVA
jgi:hypothetical protein